MGDESASDFRGHVGSIMAQDDAMPLEPQFVYATMVPQWLGQAAQYHERNACLLELVKIGVHPWLVQ
jgi:hypothetical protein